MACQFIAAAAGLLLVSSMAGAAEIKVLSTQATEDTYRELERDEFRLTRFGIPKSARF
jgi:hypothetical protein